PRRLVELDSKGRAIWETFAKKEIIGAWPVCRVLALGFQTSIESDDTLDSVKSRVERLKHRSPLFRRGAATALGQLGSEARVAIPALISTLRDGDQEVAEAAENALGQLGAEALPNMLKGLEDGDYRIRLAVTRVLGRLGEGGEFIIPSVTKIAKGDIPEVRAAAISSLTRHAKMHPAVLALILESTKDESKPVQLAALQA